MFIRDWKADIKKMDNEDRKLFAGAINILLRWKAFDRNYHEIHELERLLIEQYKAHDMPSFLRRRHEMKFKKGDMVYYHSKVHGTIPAIIRAIGKKPGKNRDSVWIRGESPTTRGYINSWVHISTVELQTDAEM